MPRLGFIPTVCVPFPSPLPAFWPCRGRRTPSPTTADGSVGDTRPTAPLGDTKRQRPPLTTPAEGSSCGSLEEVGGGSRRGRGGGKGISLSFKTVPSAIVR